MMWIHCQILLGMQVVCETKITKRSHFQALCLRITNQKELPSNYFGTQIGAPPDRPFRACNPGFVMSLIASVQMTLRSRQHANTSSSCRAPAMLLPRAPTLPDGQSCPSRGRTCVGPIIAVTSDRPLARNVCTNGRPSAETPPTLPAGGRCSK
jgi:hypothetical protein